ncbi:MAG: hypothetical protein ACR2ML_04930 [Solirubrobacteraceae bacterium]
MARRSLRPNLNQIRVWVRQGRTNAWIAHQLEVTVQQIAAFRREHELDDGDSAAAADFDDEIDLRAEDDARIAAELEAAEAASEEADDDEDAPAENAPAEDGDDEAEARPRRRRGRRGGRSRARRPSVLEGTFDHGEEGYGLWLDPAIKDDPTYAEHWAGHRPVEVVVEAEQIVIRRAGDEDEDEDDEESAA